MCNYKHHIYHQLNSKPNKIFNFSEECGQGHILIAKDFIFNRN